MLSILDFSWQLFRPDIVAAPTVADLEELARAHGEDMFVVHDTERRWTALVIPEVVLTTVQKLDLPSDRQAASVGLVDLLMHEQMTVSDDCPASLAARMASWQDASVVHVVDGVGHPSGVFVPAVVSEQLPRASLIRSASPRLREAVQVPVAQLGDAIAAVEAELTTFHSERLNNSGPQPYICRDHGLHHRVGACPCQFHPGAVCNRRAVASGPAAVMA